MKVKRKSFVYFRLRCRLRSGLPTDKLLHHMTGRHIYTFPGRVKYKSGKWVSYHHLQGQMRGVIFKL